MTLRTLTATAAGLVAAGAIIASPVAASPAAAAGSATAVINNCVGAQVRPRSFTLTCADANIQIVRARYSRWTQHAATGRGRYVYNTCTPNCASGHDKHHPVDFRLYRVRTVKGQPLFTRMVVEYAGLAEVFTLPTRGV